MMMDKVSVVRDREGLTEAQQELVNFAIAYNHAAIQDKGAIFNTDLMEALELGYMLDCADTIVGGALAREESRGAHYRTDFESARRQELACPHGGAQDVRRSCVREETGLDHQV